MIYFQLFTTFRYKSLKNSDMYDYCSFVKTEQNANMSASKSSSHHISPNGGMS